MKRSGRYTLPCRRMAMDGIWIMGLVALACDAHAPAMEAASPSLDGTPSAVTQQGASNPADCEDAPPFESDSVQDFALLDRALASADGCTKKLTKAGDIAVSLLFEANGLVGGVFVTQSTVGDCNVVECVKRHLALQRAPASESQSRRLHNVELALAPRQRPHRTKDVSWSDTSEHRHCTDPDDALNDFKAGRLPPEQIQNIIRARYPAVRRCYESGLASNRHLRGKVAIRFVIGRDGRVSDAYIQENELRDCRVAQCFREELRKCVFPKPENGIVTVVYPLMFEPG